MGGIGLKLTSMPVRRLPYLLGLSGPIVDVSWTHSYSKQCLHGCFCHILPHPTPSTSHPTHPPTSHYLLQWSEISAHKDNII